MKVEYVRRFVWMGTSTTTSRLVAVFLVLRLCPYYPFRSLALSLLPNAPLNRSVKNLPLRISASTIVESLFYSSLLINNELLSQPIHQPQPAFAGRQ